MDRAAGFRQICVLDLAQSEWWTSRDALMLLSSPALQRVSSVVSVGGVWLSEAVLAALCRLPRLTSLRMERGLRNHPSFRLHPSALCHATGLRSLWVDRCDLPIALLSGLASPLPQLTNLTLSSWRCRSHKPARGLLAWLTLNCAPMLSRLRQLWLFDLNLRGVHRDELGRWLGSMSALRYLSASFFPGCILRALLGVGPASLPPLVLIAW